VVAVTVVVPAASDVNNPVDDTVAIDRSELDQVNVFPLMGTPEPSCAEALS
jgi:hypothetical protein